MPTRIRQSCFLKQHGIEMEWRSVKSAVHFGLMFGFIHQSNYMNFTHKHSIDISFNNSLNKVKIFWKLMPKLRIFLLTLVRACDPSWLFGEKDRITWSINYVCSVSTSEHISLVIVAIKTWESDAKGFWKERIDHETTKLSLKGLNMYIGDKSQKVP